MPNYSLEQRVFVIEKYFNSYSLAAVRKAFKQKYPGDDVPVPTKTAMFLLVKKFRETGSVLDKKRVRRCSVLTDENVNTIAEKLAQSPTKSLRTLSKESGMSKSSIHRMLKKLKMQSRMKIVDDDKEADSGQEEDEQAETQDETDPKKPKLTKQRKKKHKPQTGNKTGTINKDNSILEPQIEIHTEASQQQKIQDESSQIHNPETDVIQVQFTWQDTKLQIPQMGQLVEPQPMVSAAIQEQFLQQNQSGPSLSHGDSTAIDGIQQQIQSPQICQEQIAAQIHDESFFKYQ